MNDNSVLENNIKFWPIKSCEWPESILCSQYQYIIKKKGSKNYWNDRLRENSMIFRQILSKIL